MPPQVAALVPAAGQSRRMGRCKLLLPFPEQPVIVRCLETMRNAGIQDIIIVLGEPYGNAIYEAVRHFEPTVVRNPAPDSDMAASLCLGLAHVPAGTTGILVFIPDYPLVSPATCRMLLERHGTDPESILIPVYDGRKGHPILVPHARLKELKTIPTLREVIKQYQDSLLYLPTSDHGILLDIDTPEDYQALRLSCA